MRENNLEIEYCIEIDRHDRCISEVLCIPAHGNIDPRFYDNESFLQSRESFALSHSEPSGNDEVTR